jgi:hypothetical protein
MANISSSSSVGGGGSVIGGAIGLAAASVSVWAIVCAARITISAISLLIVAGNIPTLVGNLVLSGIAGAFAGFSVATIRSWPRKSGRLQESFISAIFNKSVGDPNAGGVFWVRILIGGLIGFTVGAMNGSGGILSFPQIALGSGEIIPDPSSPIAVFIGGGFGGPGGTGILSLLFLIIVVVFAAVLVGFLAGLIYHLLLYALAGMVKGGTKTLVTNALQDRVDKTGAKEHHPVVVGMIRGSLIGLFVGILESIFTTWGVIRFYM